MRWEFLVQRSVGLRLLCIEDVDLGSGPLEWLCKGLRSHQVLGWWNIRLKLNMSLRWFNDYCMVDLLALLGFSLTLYVFFCMVVWVCVKMCQN